MFYVSSHFLGSTIEKCVALGVERDCLVSVLPDGVDTFSDGMRRYPAQVLIDIFATAKRLSGYDDLAIRIGEQVNVSSVNLAGKLLPLCDSMTDVAQMVSRYQRLTQTCGNTRINIDSPICSVDWEPYYDDALAYSDVVMSMLVNFVVAGRWLSYNTKSLPAVLEVRGPEIIDTTGFNERYNCTMKFGQPQDRLVIDPGFFSHKLASSNPELFDVILPQIDRMLYEVDNDGAVTARVAASIRSRMKQGAPSLEQTASDLNMPVRRMRAGLTAAGTTFRKIVDAERKDACNRLAGGRLKKSEIAFRLGFHDQPAFNRAYKRWYGATPP